MNELGLQQLELAVSGLDSGGERMFAFEAALSSLEQSRSPFGYGTGPRGYYPWAEVLVGGFQLVRLQQ